MGICSCVSDVKPLTMFLSKILPAADHPYLFGKGGRTMNNSLSSMQGLTIKSLKHHTALQPLFQSWVLVLCLCVLILEDWLARLQMLTGPRLRILETTWDIMRTGSSSGSTPRVWTTATYQTRGVLPTTGNKYWHYYRDSPLLDTKKIY